MRILFSILLFCLSTLTVWGQFGGPAKGGEQQVKWQVEVVPASGHQVGDVITLNFYATVHPDWHIYSVKKYPEGKFGPLPAMFELIAEESAGIRLVGELQETGSPTKEYDEIFEVDTYYFSKKAHYFQKVKITEAGATLEAKLRAQACKEGMCIPVDLDVSKRFAATAAEKKNDDNEGKGLAATGADDAKNKLGTQSDAEDATAQQATDSLAELSPSDKATSEEAEMAMTQTEKATGFWLFWVSFLAGLVALVTPCVFPLIPMTVSYFTKQSHTRGQGLRDAGIYMLSIISIFLLAGISLAAIFGQTIFYVIATDGFVNLFFFLLIFVFALSFLGWFEITLPTSWSTKADKASMKSGGLLGIFFMALTLVIASFSCTGPILALVFSYAGTGEFSDAILGMAGFSFGFAIPFGFFALFPGMLNSLPKSGGWMNAVKVTLGFIELMLCMKFLSIADQLWHWGLLDREVFIAIWIVLAFALGAYLMGFYRMPHDHQKLEKVPVPRLLVALAAFMFGATLIPGLWGAPLENLGGILPPQNREVGVKIADFYANSYAFSGSGASASPVCEVPRSGADKHSKFAPPGFCMFYDLEEAQAYAKQVNKPLLLDFTGWTCANCRLMETKVWQDAQIKKTMNEEFVIVSLYVDERERLEEPITTPEGRKLRTVGDKWLDYQMRRYEFNAQPWYAITTADMKDLLPPMGYDTDKAAYLEWLQRGLKAYHEQNK